MRTATAEYAKRPAAFAHEKRDCSVRALRIAAGIDYLKAHNTLRIAGRVTKRGAYNLTMHAAARVFSLVPIDLPASGAASEPTLAQFVRAHQKGRFVIRVNTHFLAVVNGVVHNWAGHNGARTRVKRAWGYV